MPIDDRLRIARLFSFAREEPSGSNKGRWVEALQRIGSTFPGQPWCACYVVAVLALEHGGTSPLGFTPSCDRLLERGRKDGLLFTAPEPGDVGLVMRTPTDAIHTFFVTEVDAKRKRFGTIEGNTSDPSKPPTREGYGVFERTLKDATARSYSVAGKYLFIRVPAAH